MRHGTAGMRGGVLLAALLALGTPAARADAPPAGAAVSPTGPTRAFTPAQRAAIVAIVRDALKTDPTILRDAVVALRDADARTEAASQASAVSTHRAALLTGDAVAGNPAGDVTLTEFYDPRCPYCRKIIPTLAAVIAGDRRLRVVYRVIPILGADSVTEARAILAAGRQDRSVAMADALMGSDAPPTAAADIAQAARGTGVDPARLARDMADPAITRQLRENIALANALGTEGTPMLVIGDTVIPGLVEAGEIRQAIATARS